MTKPKSVPYVARLSPPDIPENSELRSHCYLCGLEKLPLEEEHVFPKILFKGFDPGHYVKLWACAECNRAKGIDDEYVSRYLQAGSFVQPAKAGWESAMRGFQRADSSGTGLARDFTERLTTVEYKTPAGLTLGQVGAIKIDLDRIKAFATNIAKGLFVRTSLRIRDWSKHEVTVFVEQAIQSTQLFHDPIVSQYRTTARYGEYWEHIFTYFTDYGDDACVSALLVYSSFFLFVTITEADS